jgi:hypothetical protein
MWSTPESIPFPSPKPSLQPLCRMLSAPSNPAKNHVLFPALGPIRDCPGPTH